MNTIAQKVPMIKNLTVGETFMKMGDLKTTTMIYSNLLAMKLVLAQIAQTTGLTIDQIMR